MIKTLFANNTYHPTRHTALRKVPVRPALLVLGALGVQGNVRLLGTSIESLRVAIDNDAKQALVPIENKRTLLDVNAVALISYNDPTPAAMKVR